MDSNGSCGGAVLGQPAAQDRLERRRLEPARERDGLGVVVAVDQHGAPRARHAPLAEDRGVALGLQHPGLEPAGAHGLEQPFAADADALGLLAHGAETEEVDQTADDPLTLSGHEPVESIPLDHGPDHTANRCPGPGEMIEARVPAP